MESEAKFYREGARAAGITVGDPESGLGYASADPSHTPGSPAYTVEDIEAKIGSGLSNVAWALQSYSRLHGGTLPDDIEKLASEANSRRVPFRDYVSQKYNFAQREREVAEAKQKAHDDDIRRQATAEADRKWSEKTGTNPDLRRGEPSRFSDLRRAVQQDTRPDPLKLDELQRRQATRNQIRSEISEHESL